MNYIIENWYIIIAVIAIIATAIFVAVRFFELPTDKQLQKVREWLLFAVTEAEKALGSGTGKLKLRYVYDLFLSRFPWVSRLITFDAFSLLVDEALEEMRTMLNTNDSVANYVNTDKE